MDSRRLSRQDRYAAIAGAVTLTAAIAIAVGLLSWQADGHETVLSAALIGIGGFVLIMGAAATVLFLWGGAVVRNIRAGKNLVARWRLTPC